MVVGLSVRSSIRDNGPSDGYDTGYGAPVSSINCISCLWAIASSYPINFLFSSCNMSILAL